LVTEAAKEDAMPVLDLTPAADEMSALIAAVPDELLGRATPCPAYRLGDLIEHVGGLARAFAAAAAKDRGPLTGTPRPGDAARLGEDWRTRIPRDLSALAAAWRDPAAWTGMTRVGGGDLPGEIAGLAGLDELVVHGWDIARASAQELSPDPAAVEAVHGFLAAAGGPFGPVVAVPAERPLLDQVIGLAGRDPDWAPGWSGN
jgi:uncharacterized protein (TIGR03086 family)